MPTTRRGAYTRAGAADADAEIFAAAQALIRSMPVAPTAADVLAPPTIGKGVGWDEMGTLVVPDWVEEAHPSLYALREIEPLPARPWRRTARPTQLPPKGDDWLYWVIMSGRGWGKTHVGSNVLAEWATTTRGDYAMIAPTFGDARKICTEGPSGLVAALGPQLHHYNKSDYVLYLTNGSRIVLASADAPDRLRGYNLSGAWCDELASFGPEQKELWDKSLIPALRIGKHPRMIITTTPRRSAIVLRELLARAKNGDPSVHLTTGSTFENRDNLSAAFLHEMELRYKGTTVGRQELAGEMLDEVEGALVTQAVIEASRVLDGNLVPMLRRVVVGVDPCVTAGESSDACGIVVAGLGSVPMRGWTGTRSEVEGAHLYYFQDATMRGTPRRWARRALEVADEWAADSIVIETNQGGDLCTTMLRMVATEIEARTPRIKKVHASVGKRTRAEPVAGMFEQYRAHMVGGIPGVEDGFTSWVPGDDTSPNELDAAVWAAVGLLPQLAMKGPAPVKLIA